MGSVINHFMSLLITHELFVVVERCLYSEFNGRIWVDWWKKSSEMFSVLEHSYFNQIWQKEYWNEPKRICQSINQSIFFLYHHLKTKGLLTLSLSLKKWMKSNEYVCSFVALTKMTPGPWVLCDVLEVPIETPCDDCCWCSQLAAGIHAGQERWDVERFSVRHLSLPAVLSAVTLPSSLHVSLLHCGDETEDRRHGPRLQEGNRQTGSCQTGNNWRQKEGNIQTGASWQQTGNRPERWPIVLLTCVSSLPVYWSLWLFYPHSWWVCLRVSPVFNLFWLDVVFGVHIFLLL